MPKKYCRRESGAVLVVSLIVLLALTLIVLGAGANSILQENMTGSLRQSSQIFQVAESALREAEVRVSELDDLSQIGSIVGFYRTGAAPADYFNDDVWDSDKSITARSIISGINAQYFIEFVGEQELTSSVNQVQLDNSYIQVESIASTAIFRIVVRSKLADTGFSKIVSSYYSTSI